MATQPIPSIGSVTFFIHLIIIGFNKLMKTPKIILLSAPVFLVISIVSLYIFLNHRTTIVQPTIHRVTQTRNLNEKTEPITDTSFIKNEHFATWIPWWDEDRVITSLETLPKSVIEVISPIWYNLAQDGTLTTNPSTNLRSNIASIASSSGIMILPTINNESGNGFDGNRVSLFLKNKEMQSAFISKAISLAKINGYIGWDIDWEQKNPSDKQAFSDFIQYASQQFHKNNLKLVVSVEAKTDSSDTTDSSASEDWEALSENADQIRVMAYDFHYDKSDPGAITPLDELEAVLNYATQTIPKNKIVLGVPLYGYDWDNKIGQSVQYADAMSVIVKNSGSVTRDKDSEELVGQYGTLFSPHTLWFLDQKSILRILYIANNYDINQFVFWRLGGEDPEVWNLKK